AGSTTNIKQYLLLAGYLRVITKPKGAAVYIDGQYIQDTPIENYSLPLGVHEITIVKPGYTTYDQFITITAGTLNLVNVTLQANTTKSGSG
ncbi:MAG: PEGA domain-containing protein, partial [Thermococci archaeon]|nr:PEGA domain-containing protein [Thermococci archaeon]